MTPSNRPDVTFYLDEYRFSVRCSVFLSNAQGEILVQKKKTDSEDSWALPGGRLKLGESMVDGINREIAEEFDVAIREHRFLGVIEQNAVFNEQRTHELNFLYVAYYVGVITLCDDTLDCKWTPFTELDKIKPAGCGKLLDGTSSLISNGFYH